MLCARFCERNNRMNTDLLRPAAARAEITIVVKYIVVTKFFVRDIDVFNNVSDRLGDKCNAYSAAITE